MLELYGHSQGNFVSQALRSMDKCSSCGEHSRKLIFWPIEVPSCSLHSGVELITNHCSLHSTEHPEFSFWILIEPSNVVFGLGREIINFIGSNIDETLGSGCSWTLEHE